jgi:hypothetical protein
MKLRFLVVSIAAFATAAVSAQASPKEVRTRKGQSVILARLVNALPTCSIGPVPLPVVVEKPRHGSTYLTIVSTDIAANHSCSAHRGDVIAILYSPRKEFVGSDKVTFQLAAGNQTILVQYSITIEEGI